MDRGIFAYLVSLPSGLNTNYLWVGLKSLKWLTSNNTSDFLSSLFKNGPFSIWFWVSAVAVVLRNLPRDLCTLVGVWTAGLTTWLLKWWMLGILLFFGKIKNSMGEKKELLFNILSLIWLSGFMSSILFFADITVDYAVMITVWRCLTWIKGLNITKEESVNVLFPFYYLWYLWFKIDLIKKL